MKISYSDVESYCNELHSLANKMKDILDDVKNIKTKISSSETWTGAASNYYSDKLKNVSNKFDEIYDEIEYSILFMANVSDGYQSIDQDIMSEICSNLSISEPNLSNSKIFGNRW